MGQEVAFLLHAESTFFELGRHLTGRLSQVRQVHPAQAVLEKRHELVAFHHWINLVALGPIGTEHMLLNQGARHLLLNPHVLVLGQLVCGQNAFVVQLVGKPLHHRLVHGLLNLDALLFNAVNDQFGKRHLEGGGLFAFLPFHGHRDHLCGVLQKGANQVVFDDRTLRKGRREIVSVRRGLVGTRRSARIPVGAGTSGKSRTAGGRRRRHAAAGLAIGARLCGTFGRSLRLLVQDFGHLGAQDGFIHLQLGSRRLQVNGPLDGVGNGGDGRHHGADHLRALHGVVARLVREQLGLELQEILRVLMNGTVQGVAAHLLGVGVRVVTVGQKHHLHGHALGEEHVDAPQRSTNACRVPVENDRDVLGEAADKVDLACGERRAAGRDHVGHPRLVHRHHVGVALHQEAPLLLDDGGLGEVHAVQDLALVVEGALGRVEVLGDFLVCGQGTAPKPNDAACHIPNREHDPALEEVPQRSVLALLAQACLDQLLRSVSRFLRCRGQGVP